MKNSRVPLVVLGVLAAGVVITAALEASDQTTPKPKDVVLVGRIVDLQTFMTGKFDSADHAKCSAECLRAGVPAAIETDDGLVIIGEGARSPAHTISKFAMTDVEVHGKMYERYGVRYVDMSSINEFKGNEEDQDISSPQKDPDDDPGRPGQ